MKRVSAVGRVGMVRAFAGAAVLAGAVSGASAQDLTPRGLPPKGAVAIVNGAVYPVAGEPIEKGVVVFENGKITRVGPASGFDIDAAKKAGTTIVDAAGQRVSPGLIGTYTHLGLQEIAAVRATIDMAEVGVATPEVKAMTAVNPDSTLIPVARSNGVLVTGVFPLTNFGGLLSYFPGSGGLVPGRVAVMRLDGWTNTDMAVLEDAGLVIDWPMARPITAWWMNKSEEEQQKEIDKSVRVLEDLFDGARAYVAGKEADANLATDIRFEAMRSVLPVGEQGTRREGAKGTAVQRPVFVQADDYDQIVQAVNFCVKRGLKCVILGGRDAPLCADLLNQHGVSVVVLGTMRLPKRDDSAYDETFTLPARLLEAKVRFAIACGDEVAHERNLPYSAAMAVAHGLPADQGLRSLTLSAAEILGVSDTLGSLEVGKAATIIMTDGDVLEVQANVTRAWIDGREVDLSNKQTVQAARYREKYRLLEAQKNAGGGGKAP